MKDLIKLGDLTSDNVYEIFNIADEIQHGKYRNFLNNKSIILFFPSSSIRTRVTFEKGIYLLGGQSILFPSETLDKKENLKDVCGYLNNWADLVIVRHENIYVIEQLACYLNVPVVNAMSNANHPCEIIADMYALSKIRNDFISDRYLFCGKAGNIGFTWKAASDIMGFELSQCCGKGYEIEGLKTYNCIDDAIKGKDIICTDALPSDILPNFKDCQVTRDKMDMANRGAILNPCPPFYRGEEVSDDVINSSYFVGYEFKKHLLEVQQAIIVYLLLQ
ncbi:MAG: peptide transporter [Ruminococcus sp.]|nr:peptide transporter [Ruminococcus sp.]